jgi:hypothetical protein
LTLGVGMPDQGQAPPSEGGDETSPEAGSGLGEALGGLSMLALILDIARHGGPMSPGACSFLPPSMQQQLPGMCAPLPQA